MATGSASIAVHFYIISIYCQEYLLLSQYTVPVTFSFAVSWSVAEPSLLVCSNSSFPHFEVSGFDSSATNSKNKIKRKLIFNSINAKCLKHDKNILSKILLRTEDDIYYRKKCSRVLHIVPYVSMDETNTLSAWFTKIAHHKHHYLQSYNKWSDDFENSVKT